MEKEKEITKLVNVLRQIARMAEEAKGKESNEEIAQYCLEQYNRIFVRLKELDSSVTTVFSELSAGSSLTIVSIACRQLAAYYQEEHHTFADWKNRYGTAFDPENFKEFWYKGAADINSLGHALRECVQNWANQPHHWDGSSKKSKTDK